MAKKKNVAQLRHFGKHFKMKMFLASGKPCVYIYVYSLCPSSLYDYVSSLVSNPSLTYNVASSHTEPAMVPTFSPSLVHMCHCMCHSFCPGHLCFSLGQFKEHIFWKSVPPLTPTHGYVLSFVHLLNSIYSH